MRLFVGIDLPTALKQRILEFQTELKDLGIMGSWKSPDNFHLTLEFLGEIEPDRVLLLREILPKAASNCRPFGLRIGGLGGFPSLKRPHTLWTAVSGSLADLQRLKDDLHRELKQVGFRLDERSFKPHITLASRPECGGIDLSSVREKVLGECLIQELILFESKVIRGKRVYLDLIRADFPSEK